VAATANSKAGLSALADLDSRRHILSGRGAEDTSRCHDLRVGPECLVLPLVDMLIREEDLGRVRELQFVASDVRGDAARFEGQILVPCNGSSAGAGYETEDSRAEHCIE